jgi:hypothetical protein
MKRGLTHVAAFGIHRRPDLNVHRPHAELCSKRTALALLCVAQFMVVLDVSIVNVALPSIRSQLHVADTLAIAAAMTALPGQPRRPPTPQRRAVEAVV